MFRIHAASSSRRAGVGSDNHLYRHRPSDVMRNMHATRPPAHHSPSSMSATTRPCCLRCERNGRARRFRLRGYSLLPNGVELSPEVPMREEPLLQFVQRGDLVDVLTATRLNRPSIVRHGGVAVDFHHILLSH